MEDINWIKMRDLVDKDFIIVSTFPSKWNRWHDDDRTMEVSKERPESTDGWKEVFPCQTDLGSLSFSSYVMEQMENIREIKDLPELKGMAFKCILNEKETRFTDYQIKVSKVPQDINL